MKNLGRHLIAELWGCENANSKAAIKKTLLEAVKACGGTLLGVKVHQFSPHGVTGIAMIAESHIAIHTWPELGYVAIDIFTCGNINPAQAIEPLKMLFNPKNIQVMEIKRGVLFG